MGHQQGNLRLFLHFAAAILILTGCAPQIQKAVRVCPGAESALDSLSLLRLRSQNTVPLKANGQCLLLYYDEDKKHKKENFPVKLWVNPPVEIYLQGDVAFDAKGIVLGSNKDEFWLAMKPKEISTYMWGQWSEESCPEKLMVNPKTLLEALGVAEVGTEENWFLSNENAFDVLTGRNDKGGIIKKIYIADCDYLVGRIEYFDANGKTVVTMELDNYKEISKDFFVPRVIKIISRNNDGTEQIFRINLRSIKPANFSEKQKNRLFLRPEPQGVKHIYKIVNGDMIEQQQ